MTLAQCAANSPPLPVRAADSIDEAPTMMLRATDRWVAVVAHAHFTVIVAAHDIEPGSLSPRTDW